MCGIVGTVGVSDKGVLKCMLDAIKHRGPDDVGEFYDDETHVFLGHRRLSIIDLTTGGHQPMSNEGGSVQVVFNGEIYNYVPLRDDLKKKGYVFKSASDTEVLVHGYEEYGPDIFKKIDGMWAIALYDATRQLLLLSRDPAGMKPLYYYEDGAVFVFGSEIAALASCVPQARSIRNDRALKKFLLHGYIYGNDTIYKGIHSLSPATTMTLKIGENSFSNDRHFRPEKRRVPTSMPETVKEFDRIFERSVGETLQADVPVALFLSGGIDSSLVGRSLHARGVHLQSFTIGFENERFDESAIASQIARSLGFPHHTIMMSATDVARDIEGIFNSFGQPFADMSMLPTYYLSRYARSEGYKVVLTGDGADELFGGYPTHFLPTITGLYNMTPRALDTALRAIAHALPENFAKLGKKEKLARFLYGVRHDHRKAHAMWKHVFTENDLHRLIRPAEAKNLAIEDASFDDYFAEAETQAGVDAVCATMHVDFMTFLPASCLVKSDICSMQHGLELRMPFLNKSLIEFAWSLPTNRKASLFRTKKVLRASLSSDLPKEITALPKQGFVPPLSLWLSRELKPILLDMLSEERVVKTGFLEYAYVSSLIEAHLARRQDNTKRLWALMSLVHFSSKT